MVPIHRPARKRFRRILMKAFVVIGRAIRATYEELFLCVFMSVVWWLGTILVVTAAPVMLGMNRVANRSANYKRVDNSFFWQSTRQFFGRGWLLYAITFLAPAAVVFNIWFYINSASTWMRIIGVAWIWILLLVLMLIQYLFPLFWQQDEPSIKMVLRNALLLTLRFPLYTFLILLFHIFIMALSVIPIIAFLLSPALMAMTANFALVGMLQEMDLAPDPPVVPRR